MWASDLKVPKVLVQSKWFRFVSDLLSGEGFSVEADKKNISEEVK